MVSLSQYPMCTIWGLHVCIKKRTSFHKAWNNTDFSLWPPELDFNDLCHATHSIRTKFYLIPLDWNLLLLKSGSLLDLCIQVLDDITRFKATNVTKDARTIKLTEVQKGTKNLHGGLCYNHLSLDNNRLHLIGV